MKRLLLLIVTIWPYVVIGQDNPYKYWKLNGKSVNFEAVYIDSGANKEQIKDKLLAFIPTVKGLSNILENSTGITASMNGYEVDYRSMGYNRISAPIFLIGKQYGNVSIQIKDGKYRIVISTIISDKKTLTDQYYNEIFSNSEIESIILKWNKSGWATAENKIKIFKQLEQDFYKSFQINKKEAAW